MSTKLTYTGAEVQELLDKIEKGDFDNAKTLEGHPASYFAAASEFTSLAESFATEQGRVSTLYGYFNNGSANDALSLGGQLPSYYATATQYEILQQTLIDFKSLFDSMFEKDSDGNIHAKLSLWSSGGITAGGVGSGGSVGGGGISYNRLDAWSDYSADKAGYVLSALLGKDLDNRVSTLANAGYITASYLAPYALRSEIPSLVGYATQSWVGDNYLSKNGGKIIGEGYYQRVQLRLSGNIPNIMFEQYEVEKGCVGWMTNIGLRLQNANGYGLAVKDSNEPIYYWGENGSVQRTLLHSGNYSDYALPITGGRISGDLKLTSREVGNDNAHSGKLIFAGANNDYGNNDYKMGPYIQAINVGGWGKKKISFFQRDWSVEGFDADPEEVFSIMPNGNILIGSTEDSGEKLQVNGNVKANNFIGSLTGTADNATRFKDLDTSDFARFYATYYGNPNNISEGFVGGKLYSADGWVHNYAPFLSVGFDRYKMQFNGWGNALYYRAGDDSGTENKEWKTIAFTDSNVASATKLATPRTIWGQSFDGTQDVTGALTAPAITTNSLTIGGATITYDSVNEALCINGNMYALGGVTAGGA